MRNAFTGSLCHNGIHGGGIYLDEQSVTFVCQKLMIEDEYKNIVLPLAEIERLVWKRRIFPIAVFTMKDGRIYQFVIFHKSRFMRWFLEYRT